MIKTRLIFLVCFLTAVGAGVCIGVLWQRSTEKPPQQQEGWMADLNLTTEQREKIKAIWTDAMKTSNWQQQREKRDAIQLEREDAVKALLAADQKQKYEEIVSSTQKKLDELSVESRKAKDLAYEQTKAILTETQRIKYDEQRKKRQESHGRSRQDVEKKVLPAGAEPKPKSEL